MTLHLNHEALDVQIGDKVDTTGRVIGYLDDLFVVRFENYECAIYSAAELTCEKINATTGNASWVVR